MFSTTAMTQSREEVERSESGKIESSSDGSPPELGEIEFRGKTIALVEEGQIDPAYHAKVQILNDAIQDIGMGRYQWHLFCVAGFGWFADNLWPVVTGLIFTPIVYEFAPTHGPELTLGQNLGLLVGAFGWGLGCDIIGRQWAFNITLCITGVFGIIAGSSPNFAAIATFAALWSIGVGGNLPVDSAVFLEFLPGSHQWLLTVMSIWWSFGQIVGTLVAWPLIANYACNSARGCTRENNMGWRYFLFAMGGLTFVMFILRFFVFHLRESPKFLMGRGRNADAVANVHAVAEYNGKTSALQVEHLEKVDEIFGRNEVEYEATAVAAVKRNLDKFNLAHIRSLFRTKKLAFSTSLTILLWGLIGLAFPLYNAFLPYFLATRGAETSNTSIGVTYRNTVIIALMGIPGALIAGLAVELPRIGRKGAMSVATVLTGVFLFCSTTARTSNALLGWNCGYNVTSNIMYGVLYAYTPEIFPTKDRGTGNGLAATANRIFGVMAPIIASLFLSSTRPDLVYADLTTSVPIYISGTLFIVAGVLMLALPYEPRGKTSV